MIFAAGLGTRLKPLTDSMPKALVPIAGKTLLQHNLERLASQGFTDIVINIHHFSDQIRQFLRENDNFGLNIMLSDESAELLDTGGGIKNAKEWLSDEPFLVHNVDILSNADLALHSCSIQHRFRCRFGSSPKTRSRKEKLFSSMPVKWV